MLVSLNPFWLDRSCPTGQPASSLPEGSHFTDNTGERWVAAHVYPNAHYAVCHSALRSATFPDRVLVLGLS